MKFSVYIVCSSVLGFYALKLNKTLSSENNLLKEKSILRLTFNPRLEQLGPHKNESIREREIRQLLQNIHYICKV